MFWIIRGGGRPSLEEFTVLWILQEKHEPPIFWETNHWGDLTSFSMSIRSWDCWWVPYSVRNISLYLCKIKIQGSHVLASTVLQHQAKFHKFSLACDDDLCNKDHYCSPHIEPMCYFFHRIIIIYSCLCRLQEDKFNTNLNKKSLPFIFWLQR